MMKKIISTILSSLHHKILIAFLIIGIVPYLLITLYFSYLGRQTMMTHKLDTYNQQAKQSKLLIQNRLHQLKEEIEFLSKLELFDDMISSDIDGRISRLLKEKSRGLKDEAITVVALDIDNKVVASSHLHELRKRDFIDIDKTKSNGTQIIDKNLIFFSKLKASFEDRTLGVLVAIYPLKNLRTYIIHSPRVGFEIKNNQDSLISNNLQSSNKKTTIKINLENELEDYNLIYTIADREIYDFIDRFMLYLSLLLLVGIAIIVIVSRRLTKEIVNPITALTSTAKEIVKTKKYDIFVKSTTFDETSQLAKAFNQLIKTTNNTLQELDLESKTRMKRFINLTEMFNSITQIDSKKSCIDISIDRLKDILPYELSFKKNIDRYIDNSSYIPIRLNDKQKLYGYLVVEKNQFDDQLESHFFNSVASMIALQLERIELIAKIESASDAKTSFISNMSHELRTPLNAIIGFSQYLMMYEELNDEQLDTVSKIERSAVHLLGMINDILDIAKIEAGKIEINYSKINLYTLLYECKELVEPMAEKKGLYIKGLEDKNRTLTIRSDAKLLKQVIINLLSNAIKFTESGGINILVEIEQTFVIVTIIDTGIGIKKEELEMVFDEFVQLQNTNQIKHKGTGLGLPLSRQIMQALGEELFLDSKEGVGTKAVLKIKLPKLTTDLNQKHFL